MVNPSPLYPHSSPDDDLRVVVDQLQQELSEQTELASDLFEEIATLHRIGSLLGQRRETRDLQDAVLELACEALEAPAAALVVPDDFQWTVRHARGIGAPPWPTAARGGSEGLFQYVVETHRTVIVNDFQADPRMCSRFYQQLDATAVVCAPMWSQDELIGFLTVFDTNAGRTFQAGSAKLLTSVANQVAHVLENLRLHEEELEQRKLAQQIEIARSIQEKLLPVQPPEVAGVELAGLSIPAREVGGDYYDFLVLDRDRIGIVIGDVAGKGVPAAMLMTMIKGSFTAMAGFGVSPAEMLGRINEALVRERIAERFVTLCYFVYDRSSRTVTVANAGHEPLLWYKHAEDRVEALCNDRLPLGIQLQEIYHEHTLEMQRGDMLFSYTDGLTDAMNLSKQPWGMDKLINGIRQKSHLPLADLLLYLRREVSNFIGNAPPHDDMTAAVLRVTNVKTEADAGN